MYEIVSTKNMKKGDIVTWRVEQNSNVFITGKVHYIDRAADCIMILTDKEIWSFPCDTETKFYRLDVVRSP